MENKVKLKGGVLALVFATFTALLIFISLPLVSFGQTGTLGQDTPEIRCTYAQDGVEVDGNTLTAGTYDVSFVMEGAQSLSVMEITATYNQEHVTVADSPSYLISDGAAALDSMGYVLSNGNIVFGIVSTNSDCTALAEGENVIATVQMTFDTDCDAAEYITVSQNPNLTFAQADYGDGYDDSYALVKSDPEYTQGTLYLMSCDVTPALINSYDVNGQIMIATDVTGTTVTSGIGGITVTITDAEGQVAAQAVTDSQGNYTLASVLCGTYTMTISGDTTIDRTVTLEVTDAKAVNNAVTVDGVGVIICDYNKDGIVNTTDKIVITSAFADYNVYCDFNSDSVVNATDSVVFKGFFGKTIEYSEVTL